MTSSPRCQCLESIDLRHGCSSLQAYRPGPHTHTQRQTAHQPPLPTRASHPLFPTVFPRTFQLSDLLSPPSPFFAVSWDIIMLLVLAGRRLFCFFRPRRFSFGLLLTRLFQCTLVFNLRWHQQLEHSIKMTV